MHFRQTGMHLKCSSIHYIDVIMTMMASQITSLTVVYSNVYSDADQRKHQSSASLDFVWGIHRDRWIPRTKGQLRGKCFHLMTSSCCNSQWHSSNNPTMTALHLKLIRDILTLFESHSKCSYHLPPTFDLHYVWYTPGMHKNHSGYIRNRFV